MNAGALRLPLRSKLALGVGSGAFGIKDQGFNALLMLYYNQVVGLPAAWVGLAILIATLVDAVADPLIGQWSDRLQSRLGRRHPFMYAAAIPVALSYALVWMPPSAVHEIQFVYLLGVSIAVRVAISLYEVPAAALTAELTTDYDERTSLATYRFLFQALGLIGIGVLVFNVFLKPTAEQPVGQLNAGGYVQYGIVAAAIMMVCIFAAARGTHRYIPLLRATSTAQHGRLRDNLRVLLTDRTYVSVVLCIFFWAVAVGISTTLGSYVMTYLWKLTAAQMAAYSGAAGIGLFLGVIAAAASRRFGKKSVAITSFAIALVGAALLITLRLLGVIDWEGEAALPYLMLQNAVLYLGVVTGNIMGASMLADVADVLELKTGKRMEGLMFAALIMIMKAVSGMGVFGSGMILSAIGFPERADPATIDPQIVESLGLIFAISLVVLVSLAILSMSFYPITRQMQERTLADLAQARTTPAEGKPA
ncbi:MAG: MFS transporter [Pseudomonadota bacterium]|nr:MFS transporter [Pseudomonadota bacterium]